MQEQVTHFLEYLEVEQGYSQNTVSAYRNDLGQFLGYLQRLDLARRPRGWGNVTRDHIVSYMLEMKEREYASSTVARKVAAVKSFFSFLVEQGHLQKNPADELDSPKVKKRLPAAIPPEDVDRLLAAPQGESPTAYRDRALFESLYATGLRVSELVALDISDVDVDAGTVRCIGKGAKERILPVYDQALQVIDDYITKGRPVFLKSNSEEQALFLNRRGNRLTRQGLWLIIKRYVDQMDIQSHVTPHILRHSFATHMLRGGAGLREVQQMLGHANISTTQVYTQVSDDHLREVYDESHPRA